MSSQQTDANVTRHEGDKRHPTAGRQLRQSHSNEVDLGTQLKSLNLKLDEIASVVDQISQEMGTLGVRNPESAAWSWGVNATSSPDSETCEPGLVYRLCALMDLLRRQYGFDDSGVFSLNPITGRLEVAAISPHPGSTDTPQRFEEQVGILWKNGDIQGAIEQQKRTTLAAPHGGSVLVVPMGTGDQRRWFWVMCFREDHVPESLSAADLVLWTEILHCCVERSGPHDTPTSPGQDESNRMNEERIRGTVQLGRALTHEINNPLQVIMGRTQLLKMNLKKPGGQPNDKILDIIEASAGRICSLVKDFSDHLHRQSDEITEGKEVNLLHILESDLPLLQHLLNSRKINLETNLRETLPSVSGNPGELETAVLILIRELQERLSSGGTMSIGAGAEGQTVFVDLKASAKDLTAQAQGRSKMCADRVKKASTILDRFGGSLEVKGAQAGQVDFHLRLKTAPTQVKNQEPGSQPAACRQAPA
jgi:hypothetical protein